jgi:gluconolactonase
MTMDLEIVAEGLRFPEGPIAMDDGSVILVEIARGTLTRCWKGKTEIIASIGGGPNGAAIGPDGAVYVCNNGGSKHVERNGILIPAATADDYTTGRVERIDLKTGKVERLYDKVGDHPLRGPNDLVFDKSGGFWFTDYGKDHKRSRDKSGIYYAKPDGSSVVEVTFGSSGYNGIGLSPDETVVYAAETSTGRLWAFDITGPGDIKRERKWLPGRVVATMPGRPQIRYFDSLAVTASGRVCVATLLDPGITSIAPDGTYEFFATPDIYTTNICFGGKDMRDAWITLSGTGRLGKARWSEPGLRLNFNA